MGGGIGMGKTCEPKAFSFQCMTEFTTNKKKKRKNLPARAGDGTFDPWVGKIPWRRKWQPTPVFLLGESHGQRSLVSDSLWVHRVGHG